MDQDACGRKNGGHRLEFRQGAVGFLAVVPPFTETTSDSIMQGEDWRERQVSRAEYEAGGRRGSNGDRVSKKSRRETKSSRQKKEQSNRKQTDKQRRDDSYEHSGCTICSRLMLDYWEIQWFTSEGKADLHGLCLPVASLYVSVCVCRQWGRNFKYALENKQGPPFQPG